MFEKATKQKLRFKTILGNITIEDLWDMPLSRTLKNKNLPITEIACLDDLAIKLNKINENFKCESFVTKKTNPDNINELKFNIVKKIIKTKIEDIENKENIVIIKTENKRINQLIIEKENEELKEMSIEDLKKRRIKINR